MTEDNASWKQVRVRMQKCLNRLGVPLRVVWAPKPSDKRGEIQGGCLLIYDAEEAEAWSTLYHEIVEYRLKEVTGVYRSLVNQLIEGYETLAYQRKEQFIEFLPKIAAAIQAERSKRPRARPRKSP